LNIYNGNEKDAVALMELSNLIMSGYIGKASFLFAAGAIITLISWKRHGTDFKMRINDPWYLRPIFVLMGIFSMWCLIYWRAINAVCLSLKGDQEVLNYISRRAGIYCNIDYSTSWIWVLFIWVIFLATKQKMGKILNKIGWF
tara:strand:+ start:1597 stop:2025 length:429 start_codon:yes stop_codon:yes gene_type:complete